MHLNPLAAAGSAIADLSPAALLYRAAFAEIRPGYRVTVALRRGRDVQHRSGRVAIKNHNTRTLVLNMGGRHGTPLVCDQDNFVSFKASAVRATV